MGLFDDLKDLVLGVATGDAELLGDVLSRPREGESPAGPIAGCGLQCTDVDGEALVCTMHTKDGHHTFSKKEG